LVEFFPVPGIYYWQDLSKFKGEGANPKTLKVMINRRLRDLNIFPALKRLWLILALACIGCSDGVFIETPEADPGFLYPPEGFFAPPGLRGAALSPKRIRVSWNPVPEAVKYRIYQADSALEIVGSVPVLGETNADSTDYEAVGLAANTDYCYRVSAVNAGGEEALSQDYITVKTLENLSAPAGFRGDSPSPVTAALFWHPVPDADRYIVYRSGSSAGTYTPVIPVPPGPITQADFHDITVDPLTAGTYYYKVSAVDSGGKESALSLDVTIGKSKTAVFLNPAVSAVPFTPGNVHYYYYSGPASGTAGYNIQWTENGMTGEHLRVWVYQADAGGEVLLDTSIDPTIPPLVEAAPGKVLIVVEGQAGTSAGSYDLSYTAVP
jgi:hypothetical protein